MKIIESTFNKWKVEKKKINEYNRYNDPQDEELADDGETMEITFFEKITIILTLNVFKTYRSSRVDIDYPEIFVNLPEVYQEKITEIVEKYASELENSNSIKLNRDAVIAYYNKIGMGESGAVTNVLDTYIPLNFLVSLYCFISSHSLFLIALNLNPSKVALSGILTCIIPPIICGCITFPCQIRII